MIIYWTVFIAGMFAGSFILCMAERTIRKENDIAGRSRCDFCFHTLQFYDLFPVVSWIVLRGHCRYCHSKISIRYPLSELMTAFVFLILFLRFGWTDEYLKNLLFSLCLLYLSWVDWKTMEIPMIGLFIPFTVWFIHQNSIIIQRITLMAGVFIILYLCTSACNVILKKESMGMGDILLYSLCGLYLGTLKLVFLLLLSSTLALICLIMKKDKNKPIPFAPFITMAVLLLLITGDSLAYIYWNFI